MKKNFAVAVFAGIVCTSSFAQYKAPTTGSSNVCEAERKSVFSANPLAPQEALSHSGSISLVEAEIQFQFRVKPGSPNYHEKLLAYEDLARRFATQKEYQRREPYYEADLTWHNFVWCITRHMAEQIKSKRAYQ